MQNVKICVIGLGYVGLPLARLFSTKYKTIGFDMTVSFAHHVSRTSGIVIFTWWRCQHPWIKIITRI